MINLSLLNFGATEITLVSIFGALLIGIIVYLCFVPMKSYFTAIFSGCYISSFRLISIKNRKLNVADVVSAYIMSKKAKINVSLDEIENLFLSEGNPIAVFKAMNMAKDANIKLDYKLAAAIELTSHNVCEVVQNSILSKVEKIEGIKGITQDNFELVVGVRFSVKINLLSYTTGLGLDDLKSTLSAWIMENISRTKDHKLALKSPSSSLLSNVDVRVLTQKSMFDILDMNISSIDISRDLNAEREIKSAEKEKIYAQIEAERMKNAEEIKELQMKTKTEQMKSTVLQAESEVPLAISQAIKEGRFSVMDYYKLMNLQADTALRRAIINDNKNSSSDDEEGDF